jgi:hypothetical protein
LSFRTTRIDICAGVWCVATSLPFTVVCHAFSAPFDDLEIGTDIALRHGKI